MAVHTENALSCACIAQILDLPFTVPAFETIGAKGLVSCQYGQILDLVSAAAAAVRAIIAYKGAVPQ